MKTSLNQQNQTWSNPIPLTSIESSSIAYPINALPQSLDNAVSSYLKYGQKPAALVATSALANISLACQSIANVARDSLLTSPTSLFFLVVASSGERKSAADTVFSRAIREWEQSAIEETELDFQDAQILHQAWAMERDGLLNQIKKSALNGEDTSYHKQLLKHLNRNEPEIPLLPSLYYEDTTQEALTSQLASGWPSAALWSDEAAVVFSSHSMQSNPGKFVAMLNRLWDGKSIITHRKTSKNANIKGRRLTLDLMMQPILLERMNAISNGIKRQSGFLARCLMAYPSSSMGTRYYQEPPSSYDYMNDYESRITDCLNQSQHLTVKGCIDLPTLHFSTDAKKIWVQFFNQIEAGLSCQGQWQSIKDFASKSAENAARLAALFHLYEGAMGDISAAQVERAITIIDWHLQEARRLFSLGEENAYISDAKRLLEWLIDKDLAKTTPRHLQQFSPLRDKSRRDRALELLTEHHMIRLSHSENKTIIEVNPLLFG